MAAWPVTALRQHYPDAEIHWATEPMGVPVIDTEALVQKVHVFPRDRWKRERARPRTWAEQVRTYLTLREVPYDLAIDFQGHSKTALAVRLSGARKRVSVQATDALSARLNPVPIPRDPDDHWVDHHFKVLATLGVTERPRQPIMPYASLPEAEFRRRAEDSRPMVTICTGGSHESKRYPVERWREVARLLQESGYRVVSVGGPGDPHLGSPFEDQAGTLTLRESMEMIRASAVHLATDTGTGHIAAAVGTPVVSLFPDNDRAIRRFRPYTDRGVVVRADNSPVASLEPTAVFDAVRELGLKS